MKRLALACALLALALLLTWPPAAGAGDQPPVRLRLLNSLAGYPQGGSYPLALELVIAPGYHLNPAQPADPQAVPTRLAFQTAPGLKIAPPRFPPPREMKLAFSERPVPVLGGKVLLRTRLRVLPGAAPGTRRVKVILSYQACTDQACLMPRRQEFEFPIVVLPAGSRPRPLNQEVFATPAEDRNPTGG